MGFWATTAWGVAALAFSGVLHALAVVVLLEAASPSLEASALAAASVGSIGGAAAVVLLCRLHGRLSLRGDLAMRLPTATALLAWLAANMALYALNEIVGRLLHPDWASTGPPLPPVGTMVAYAVMFLLAAPLFEEILFRGFLHSGWSRSRLGVPGTILLTSALWTALHLPTSALGLTGFFVQGLLLGLARHYSGSLYVPLAMHFASNLAIRLHTWLPG